MEDEEGAFSSTEKGSSISPIWGIVLGAIAIVIAIVAIVLIFVIPGPEGPIGKDGKTGNDGSSALTIKYSYQAAKHPAAGYAYTMPQPYNYANIYIPTVPARSDIYFIINATNVQIGDVFVIDNTNNPTSDLRVQYSGFENNISSSNEVSVNNLQNGLINMFYVQIGAGKSSGGKNIILTSNPV
jgi:hypothetical protein